MKTLVIMRHAVAGRGGRDFDRPLKARGRKQGAVQAARLKAAVGAVDLAITSGAARTRQTLEALRSGGLEVGKEIELPSLYSGSWREALAEIRRVDPDADSILVVGHEPTVSVMTAMLSKDSSANLGYLSTGFSAAQFVWGEVESWQGLGTATFEVRGVQRPAM